MEHFVEHREENNHLTLWQFLQMHYANDNIQDEDYAKDMKLPFKSHDHCMASIVNLYMPSQKMVIIKPVLFIENQHFKIQESFFQSIFLSNIWQPPRIC